MNWREQAACRGMGASMFVLDKREQADVAKAKAVCARCPVTSECEGEAMNGFVLFGERLPALGVWGGTSGKERIQLKRLRRTA